MQFWLISTDHFTDKLWFKEEDDFRAAMNIPPLITTTMSVQILSFILMSNHVHFILAGSRDDAQIFINRFKKMYSQRFSKKYGSQSLLLKNGTDIRELTLEDESLERGIAYVQMNSVAANISLTASDYPWGTGNTFFRTQKPAGTLVGEMSSRALIACIHSESPLPGNYLIKDGVVDTASYVAVEFVESLFRTPKRMNFFLQHSSKAKRMREGISFDDSFVLSALGHLCYNSSGERNFSKIPESQKSEVLKQIRYRFSADPNQLARVSGLSYEDVCRLLELI